MAFHTGLAGKKRPNCSAKAMMSAKHAGKTTQQAATIRNANGFANPKYGRGYIDASHECCVIFRAVSRGDTEADCLDQDALQARVEKAVGAVTVEEGGT